MQATKKSQYALRAMIVLGKEAREVYPLRLIAEEENIPIYYLEKIFSKLERGGLIESKRGSKGGYFLKKKPREITLKDIFSAVGENIAIVECINKKCYRDEKCTASLVWKRVNKKIEDSLSAIKLSDLLN